MEGNHAEVEMSARDKRPPAPLRAKWATHSRSEPHGSPRSKSFRRSITASNSPTRSAPRAVISQPESTRVATLPRQSGGHRLKAVEVRKERLGRQKVKRELTSYP